MHQFSCPGQNTSHLSVTALQIGVPTSLTGSSQRVQLVPHESTLVLLTQPRESHSCVPDGQSQRPDWQVLPPVHMLPHLPQLLLSLSVSMHEFDEHSSPVVQRIPHDRPSQVATP